MFWLMVVLPDPLVVKLKPPLIVLLNVNAAVPVLIELFPVKVIGFANVNAELFVLIVAACNVTGLEEERVNVPKSVPILSVPPKTVFPVTLLNARDFVEPPETPFRREMAPLTVVERVVLAAPNTRFPL